MKERLVRRREDLLRIIWQRDCLDEAIDWWRRWRRSKDPRDERLMWIWLLRSARWP